VNSGPKHVYFAPTSANAQKKTIYYFHFHSFLYHTKLFIPNIQIYGAKTVILLRFCYG